MASLLKPSGQEFRAILRIFLFAEIRFIQESQHTLPAGSYVSLVSSGTPRPREVKGCAQGQRIIGWVLPGGAGSQVGQAHRWGGAQVGQVHRSGR